MRAIRSGALAVGFTLLVGCDGGVEATPAAERRVALPAVVAPERALTFARRATTDGSELLLVTAADDEHVEAVVVPGAHDPLEALAELGRDGLRARLAAGRTQTVPLEALGIPIDLAAQHVAAGANFREHGDEVGVEDPFLFPKHVVPTVWSSPVPAAARLDYEVELCFVTLRPVTDAADLGDAFGLLLCNDFTDRWTLVKGMLRPGPMGTRGFADAKGQPGFLPVGPFLVVPESLDAFLEQTILELWVNGGLRQRAPVTDMIWPLPELIARSLADEGARYSYGDAEIPLLAGAEVPARGLVLSGTPGGVAFSFGNLWRGGAYLEPGDEVVARATGLGVLRNRVAREARD